MRSIKKYYKINNFDLTLFNLLKKGNLLFLGLDLRSLPKFFGEYNSKRIHIYINERKKLFKNFKYKINFFKDVYKINMTSDVIFLFDKYVLNIIKGLPFNSLYVAISLNNPIFYPFIMIGIIRRIILRKYSLHRIKILKINERNIFLLFLKRRSPINDYEFYLSRDIGIEKFLNFLYIKNINYVIPRFYEDLPNLRSKTSDLDLIVSQKHVHSVKKFLISNTGDIRVDVWSTSSKDNRGINYLNKELLNGILDRKEKGPCQSKIPCLKDYLNLLIYHSLYHKGYLSGIKSDLIKNNTIKTNKYSDLIKKLAQKNNLKVGNTMEEMHLYLKKEGWEPNNLQLNQLSKKNIWIKDLKKSLKIRF